MLKVCLHFVLHLFGNFVRYVINGNDMLVFIFLRAHLLIFLSCSMWNWQGYRIRYQHAGKSGPALVLVHGFGANRYML